MSLRNKVVREAGMEVHPQGLLFIISGPSGVGKGTVCARLLAKDASSSASVSATTRLPRPGEKDGIDYHFLTKESFLALRKSGGLLEWAEVFGNFYGTPKAYVEQMLAQGKNVILEIDTQGAMQVKAAYPSAVSIFLLPPSLAELRRRIRSRGTEEPDVLELRLSRAQEEIAQAAFYDYTVINNQVEETASCLAAIIAEAKIQRQKGESTC